MTEHGHVAALESTLRELVPALGRLRAHAAAQRQAVVVGDVHRVMAITAEQEATSARVAALEQRRQAFQQALESALNVRGIREVAEAAAPNASDRQRLLSLLDEVRVSVVQLQDEQRRCAAMLETAADVSRRMQATLARYSTQDATYGPRLSRMARIRRAASDADPDRAPLPDASITPVEAV